MLVEEARWFESQVAALTDEDLFPLLNVGSSTEAFRMHEQPWIDTHVFAPMRSRRGRVLHMDLKRAPGVDLTGDVTADDVQRELRGLNIRSVICSNLLEHVDDRQGMAQALVDIVPPRGLILVSCPYRYPRHDDPIDNGYRPTAPELAALFPGTRTLAASTVAGGTYFDTLDRSWARLARSIARAGAPFYAPERWRNSVRHLPWLTRRFAATCVLLRKASA